MQTNIPPTVVIGLLIGAYVLVGHLEHQDQVAGAQAYCESKGLVFNLDTEACVKPPPRPECEPARRHKPTTSTTRNFPEYCNHATPSQSH